MDPKNFREGMVRQFGAEAAKMQYADSDRMEQMKVGPEGDGLERVKNHLRMVDARFASLCLNTGELLDRLVGPGPRAPELEGRAPEGCMVDALSELAARLETRHAALMASLQRISEAVG